MKKRVFIILLCSLLVPLLMVGCSDRQDGVSSINNNDWKERIQLLNQEYLVKCYPAGNQVSQMPSRYNEDSNNKGENEHKEEQDTKELKEESNSVMYYDLLGFQQGEIIGKILGGFWGALAGGTAVGATLSIIAYIEQGEEAQVYDPTDLSFGGPNMKGDFTDIDRRDPISMWNDFSVPTINTTIGMDAGLIHNYVICQLLNEKSFIEYTDLSDRSAILENVLRVLQDSRIYRCDTLIPIIQDQLFSCVDNIKMDDVEFVKNNFDESVVNLQEFYDIAFNLDSALMWEYADKYSTIIEEAYEQGAISEEDALYINGSISIGCYSRMLWINYMPMPEHSSLRVAFNTTENKVTFCEKDYLPILRASEDITFWGIPHFVNGNLAEIYFYEEELSDYLGCTIEEYFEKNSTLQEKPFIITMVSSLYDVCGIWGCREIIEVPNSHNLVYYTTSYPQ